MEVGNRQTRVDSYATGVGRLPILHFSANFEMQCMCHRCGRTGHFRKVYRGTPWDRSDEEFGTYVCVVAWDQQGHQASCPEVCTVSTASGYPTSRAWHVCMCGGLGSTRTSSKLSRSVQSVNCIRLPRLQLHYLHGVGRNVPGIDYTWTTQVQCKGKCMEAEKDNFRAGDSQ